MLDSMIQMREPVTLCLVTLFLFKMPLAKRWGTLSIIFQHFWLDWWLVFYQRGSWRCLALQSFLELHLPVGCMLTHSPVSHLKVANRMLMLALLLSRNDFATYAETCFQKFGDRVKQWMTINEPHAFAQGYDVGPYIAGHNVLLAHATAIDIYRKKYKEKQQGSIGIAFDSFWYEPATNLAEDIQAAQRVIEFNLGWFVDPLVFGDYPTSMRTRVGCRLPRFSKAEFNLLKGSLDFVGINHYTT